MVGMGLTFWVSCYLVVWWTVLFTILPLGVRSHDEEGTERHPGADWGAPANPNIKKKFLTTTWISALVLAVLFVVVEFGLIPLPNLGSA
jgi:predicted secreted protein